MAAIVTVQVAPLVASGTVTYPIRIAGGGRSGQPYTGILGVSDWRSGVVEAPTYVTAIGFDDTGWTGGAIPQTADLEFSTSDRTYLDVMASLYWRGARVLVHVENLSTGAMEVDLVGTVLSASVAKGRVRLVITDLSGDLSRPAITATFAGTGGIEGGEDAIGRLKRRSWGRVFNVEARLLDKANNIYEVGDPSQQLNDIVMVKDKGLSGPLTTVAWQGSIADTFSALKSATAPQGGAAVAPSIACVKWWTVPAGPLTADLRGEGFQGAYVETIDGVARAIVGGVVPTTFGFQFNATRPYAVGMHCDDANETGANLLDRLLLPCGLPWSLSPAGIITVDDFSWTAQVEVLYSQEVEREAYLPPLQTRKLGFQRNQRVQGDSEISSVLLAGPGDATYADGTPIDVLRPAEAGANITENRNAAGFYGQGPIATLPNLYFGSPYLLEQQGGATATLNAFKTILGQAASIFAQGALATLSYVKIGNPGTGSAALYTQDLSPTSDSTVITSLGQAASIFGQTVFATLAAGTSLDNSAFGMPSRLGGLANGDMRSLRASAVLFEPGDSGFGNFASVAALRPGEAGANITEARNAAGFQGQGALATLAFVQFGSSRTVTTSDGTTVTDATVVTVIGVAAGFTGQGGLATKDQTGYYDIKLGDLADDSAGTMANFNNGYQAPAADGVYPVPGLSGTLQVKPNGVFYGVISGSNTNTGGYPDGAFTSLQFLAGGSVILDLKIPRSGGANGDLTSYVLLAVNPRAAVEDITWRVVVRSATNPVGGVSDRTTVQRMSVQTFWKAI